MGKKDDWCSKAGCKARKKGMKKKESNTRKICMAICFGISAIIFLVIGGLFCSRAGNAAMINVDFERQTMIDNAADIAAAAAGLCSSRRMLDHEWSHIELPGDNNNSGGSLNLDNLVNDANTALDGAAANANAALDQAQAAAAEAERAAKAAADAAANFEGNAGGMGFFSNIPGF